MAKALFSIDISVVRTKLYSMKVWAGDKCPISPLMAMWYIDNIKDNIDPSYGGGIQARESMRFSIPRARMSKPERAE
jgi:hypothetical protein